MVYVYVGVPMYRLVITLVVGTDTSFGRWQLITNLPASPQCKQPQQQKTRAHIGLMLFFRVVPQICWELGALDFFFLSKVGQAFGGTNNAFYLKYLFSGVFPLRPTTRWSYFDLRCRVAPNLPNTPASTKYLRRSLAWFMTKSRRAWRVVWIKFG